LCGQKGDVIRATDMVDRDPIFGKSEILILGAAGDTIIGTNFIPGHKGQLFRGTWSAAQIGQEIAMGAWEKRPAITGQPDDYILEVVRRTL
jgi:hypothetical protein